MFDLFKEYMPRAACMYYEQNLIYLHILGDGLLFLSYLFIGILLLISTRKVPKIFRREVVLFFGISFVLCGITHGMNVLAIWHTYYQLDAWIKVLAGIVGTATFLILPNATSRVKEMKEYEQLKKETAEAKEKAKEADEKAHKLLNLIQKYENGEKI